MGFFEKITNLIRNKDPVIELKLMKEQGNGIWQWNGQLYNCELLRSIVRPLVVAAGKFDPVQVRKSTDPDGKITTKINPDVYIRMLLNEPNPFMTGQKFREKLAWHYCFNGNAFAYLVRDANGFAVAAYPLNAASVRSRYNHETGQLFLQFSLTNGRTVEFPYDDIIHLPRDVGENDIFGTDPAPILAPLMKVVTATDGSILSAIKNGGIIKWILAYARGMRPEDLKARSVEFAKQFLTTNTNDGVGESDSVGVAAVGADATLTQVHNTDYVPNALIMDKNTKRVLEFFNTNEKIVMNTYNEDEWNAFYEGVVEPFSRALSEEFTRKVFSRRERGFGNSIIFDSTSLQYASMSTKLGLQAMVDRGAMTPNQWRQIMNMGPTGTPEGDQYLRRLDTGVANQRNAKNLKRLAAKAAVKRNQKNGGDT